MNDLIRLRNANLTLFNHQRMQAAQKAVGWKEGDQPLPEVPISHDDTFPILVTIVDVMQEMQDEAKALLEFSTEHEDARAEEADLLAAKHKVMDIELDDTASESDREDLENRQNAADDEYQKAHTLRAALGDKVVAAKKNMLAKLSPIILQLDLVAASCGLELYNNVPAYFNALAKQSGLLGVEV